MGTRGWDGKDEAESGLSRSDGRNVGRLLHLARLLAPIDPPQEWEDPPQEWIDRCLMRDAQRVIEAIETLVRMHTAQEEDIYEAVAGPTAA